MPQQAVQLEMNLPAETRATGCISPTAAGSFTFVVPARRVAETVPVESTFVGWADCHALREQRPARRGGEPADRRSPPASKSEENRAFQDELVRDERSGAGAKRGGPLLRSASVSSGAKRAKLEDAPFQIFYRGPHELGNHTGRSPTSNPRPRSTTSGG